MRLHGGSLSQRDESHSGRLQTVNKTWYYPRIENTFLLACLAEWLSDESQTKRTWRFPALAAGEADAEGGRPAERRRRRTPGLRREEVAELAGIGVDWYIRLEQGRTVSPSVATIDALARALRLGKAEHKHLRALTQDTDRRAFVAETVPAAVRRTSSG
jgi:hypothetical protein